MTPERWGRIKNLFEAALKRDPKERFGFVSTACRGDLSLRDEVLHLISLDEESTSSLHEPYFDVRKAFLDLRSERRAIALGEVLAGRFLLVRLIGEGGMGEVYKAFDPELQEHVALKAIRAEIASDPKSIARLKREFQMARRVTHANVCRIYDLDRHTWPNGRPCVFLTMELIEGETLAQRLRRAGKMPVEDALPIVVQMVQALTAAHRQGVVHRDFKPSNVMLDDSSGPSLRAVVTDFGLARQARQSEDDGLSSLTEAGKLFGTPAYMAPEQLRGKEATPATDVYALGLVVFEMITGVRPFQGDSALDTAMRRLEGPVPSPRASTPDLEPAWETALARCLEPDPYKRYETPTQFLEGLLDKEPSQEPSRVERSAGAPKALEAAVAKTSPPAGRPALDPPCGPFSGRDPSGLGPDRTPSQASRSRPPPARTRTGGPDGLGDLGQQRKKKPHFTEPALAFVCLGRPRRRRQALSAQLASGTIGGWRPVPDRLAAGTHPRHPVVAGQRQDRPSAARGRRSGPPHRPRLIRRRAPAQPGYRDQ